MTISHISFGKVQIGKSGSDWWEIIWGKVFYGVSWCVCRRAVARKLLTCRVLLHRLINGYSLIDGYSLKIVVVSLIDGYSVVVILYVPAPVIVIMAKILVVPKRILVVTKRRICIRIVVTEKSVIGSLSIRWMHYSILLSMTILLPISHHLRWCRWRHLRGCWGGVLHSKKSIVLSLYKWIKRHIVINE